eukprot:TRINITY_DN5924_c0_g2_i1.p1 TRINITY_DN5924_c0_g2~~TRINITY_DN5924_c0_g2_i1.p1  ORF type:complete len:511 (+),score=75.95 TRINITY_DN5924_c0_g2_i1:49-1581(+)
MALSLESVTSYLKSIPAATRIGAIATICATTIGVLVIRKFIKSTTIPKGLRSFPNMHYAKFLYLIIFNRQSPLGHRIHYPEFVREGIITGWMMGKWIVFVRDPSLIQQVISKTEDYPKVNHTEEFPDSLMARFFGGSNIVTSNGDTWRRQRKIVNPAFYKKNIATIADNVFVRSVNLFMEEIAKIHQAPLDAHHLMQKFTLDVLGLSGFSFDFENIKSDESEYVKVYNSVMKGIFDPIIFLFPMVMKIPFLRFKEVTQSLDRFESLLKGIIAERRQQRTDEKKADQIDLLNLMIDSNEGGEGLSDEELYHNMVIFFLAGHDTTAASLSIALYFLAKYPETQDKVRNEINSILGTKTVATYHDQAKFEYLNCVIKETLRLFPPVAQFPMRNTVGDVELGSGVLPKGTLVSVDSFQLQRRKEEWGPDAEEFVPERFEDEEAHKKRHPYSWIPFGAGTRSCLGMDFSLIEQRMVLATLLKKYRVTLTPGHEELKLKPVNLLQPDNLLLQFVPL